MKIGFREFVPGGGGGRLVVFSRDGKRRERQLIFLEHFGQASAHFKLLIVRVTLSWTIKCFFKVFVERKNWFPRI